MSSNGILVFDGNGANNAFNSKNISITKINFKKNWFLFLAYFTVEESEKGRIRFHNNYNYLAFEGKQACIMSFVCFHINI
jgi:hypothetical protein